MDSAKKQTAALLQRKSPPSEPARGLRSAAACPCRRYCLRIHLTPHIAASWSCSQVKVLYAKRPPQLMRRGKGIYARGSSGKAGGVIRHCRRVKANRGCVFRRTLRMAGLPITLCSLVQCAVGEKRPSEPDGSDAMARRSGDLDSSAIGRQCGQYPQA